MAYLPPAAPQRTKRIPRKRRSPIFTLFEFVGVIAGALSLTNLVRDLGWVTLSGPVWQILDSYAAVVARIVDVLIGWIDIPWVEFTDAESHAVVLSSLLLAAAGRVVIGASRRASPDLVMTYGRKDPDVDWDSETPPPGTRRFFWRHRHAIVRGYGTFVGVVLRMVLLFLVASMTLVALGPGDQTIGLLIGLLVEAVFLLSPTFTAAALMKLSRSYDEDGQAAHRALVRQLRRPFFLSVAAVIALATLIILVDLAAQWWLPLNG